VSAAQRPAAASGETINLGTGELITGGVDVGTGAIKAALVATSSGPPRVLATHLERILRRDPARVAELAWSRACERAGVPSDQVAYVASTGEGHAVEFATGHFFGMTTHARGATFLIPEARTVVDMGALHTRVFAIDPRSRVLRHRMTSQCASGTGQFLEDIVRYLGVRLEDVGALSLEAQRSEVCSGVCAVLAETDVINMVSRGVPTGELLRGIHESIAQRIVKLVRTIGAESPVVITGGLARDAGLKGAIERRFAEEGAQLEVRTHPLSAYAGALGAALWGAIRHRRLSAPPDADALSPSGAASS